LKKFAIFSIATFVLVSCATAAAGQESFYEKAQIEKATSPSIFEVSIEAELERQTLLDLEKIESKRIFELTRKEKTKDDKWISLELNRIALNDRIKNVLQYVGSTKYSFSGSTPLGWDCSGLVKWFYEDLGVELPHSASAQSKSGSLVLDPKPGDIIAIREPGFRNFHHTGIYVGNNQMIHAGWSRGNATEVLNLNSNYLTNSEVIIIRLIDSN
jgi:cell wall-associated NlpC family hydrolase